MTCGFERVPRVCWFLLCVFMLHGCATLQPAFTQPTVKLVSVTLLPSGGFEQRFAVDLLIGNPNAVAINLTGMSYSLDLQGHRVVEGLASDIPRLPAYEETRVDLEATLNLIQGLQLLQELLRRPQEPLDYRLTAELALDSAWLPPVKVVEAGTISLSDRR